MFCMNTLYFLFTTKINKYSPQYLKYQQFSEAVFINGIAEMNCSVKRTTLNDVICRD